VCVQARQSDREEIRRKLAMGAGDEDYYGGERSFKKPSLSSRLQTGKNLQLCYMNDPELAEEEAGDVAVASSSDVTSPLTSSVTSSAFASQATSSQSHHNLSTVLTSGGTGTTSSVTSASSVTHRGSQQQGSQVGLC
jgi:hypothetical protein